MAEAEAVLGLGRRLSYPEWGVGNFGDNPFFIQQMHDWFMINPVH
jgi:hypothetical protein